MLTKEHLLSSWRSMNVNEKLLKAFEAIPREIFVPPKFQSQAYDDHPLPTLREQSISQPTTIMLMLQALGLKEGEKVFEVGAGVGYQAALIAEVIGEKGKLVTTEIIPELVYIAQKHLRSLGFRNATILEADGSEGYEVAAPYDRIIITAACQAIPQPLVDQLREGGVIIAPVGDIETQMMVKGTKINENLEFEFLGTFCFVPMKGKYGFKEEEIRW